MRDTCTSRRPRLLRRPHRRGRGAARRARPTHLDGVRERFLRHFADGRARAARRVLGARPAGRIRRVAATEAGSSATRPRAFAESARATPARAPAPARCSSPTARCARPPSSRSPPRPWSRRSRSREAARARLRHGARRTRSTCSSRPGHELIARFGGLHRFMRWDKPVITDSGGFQVFSMGHGTVADEIKGRAAARRRRAGRDPRHRRGGRDASAPTSTAPTRFMGPETSMEVQAALGSDIALVFDECTPFHGSRDYTARSTERTHRWLDRCLAWHAEHGPDGPGRLRDRPGRRGGGPAPRRRPRRSPRARPCGIAIGGTLGEDKDADVRGRRLDDRGAAARSARATCSASATSTTSCAASSWASTRSTARCRRGSAATAWRSCPIPERRWRVDLAKGALPRGRRAAARGLPVPGLRARLHARLPALPAAGRASTTASGCSRSTTSPTCSG